MRQRRVGWQPSLRRRPAPRCYADFPPGLLHIDTRARGLSSRSRAAHHHDRTIERWWKHAPGSIAVTEEEDCNRACRMHSLDTHVTQPVFLRTAKAHDAGRHTGIRREPLVDDEAQ